MKIKAKLRAIYEESDVRSYIHAEANRLGTMSDVARVIGVTPQFIGLIVHDRARPSEKVLAYFGLRRAYHYERISE